LAFLVVTLLAYREENTLKSSLCGMCNNGANIQDDAGINHPILPVCRTSSRSRASKVSETVMLRIFCKWNVKERNDAQIEFEVGDDVAGGLLLRGNCKRAGRAGPEERGA
jgi:hypothetical protein